MGKIPIVQIAKLREQKGLTQAELALAIDSDISTVRNLERSRNGIKSIQRIVKLCKALGCSVEDLILMVDVEEIGADFDARS
ncbi:MAG: helix-turn-helix transcriptional regulator [Xenococcaceae cyanobacterium]